jgi:type III pantothenate kinase
MRLVVDIGNTTAHAAFCRDGTLLRQDRFVHRRGGDLASFLDRFVRRGRAEISEIGVASVEPAELARFLEWAGGLRVPVRVVGKDLPVPLRHDYREPERLGIDRLVDAHAVRRRFGGDWIVINLGTAVTVDAVTASGEFRSGAILPGLWIGLHGLARDAAQLPEIDRLERAALPTRSTEEAMVSGILVGLAGMVDRVAETLAGAVGIPARAVATGGDARRIAPNSTTVKEIVPGLTLLGIDDLLATGTGDRGATP